MWFHFLGYTKPHSRSPAFNTEDKLAMQKIVSSNASCTKLTANNSRICLGGYTNRHHDYEPEPQFVYHLCFSILVQAPSIAGSKLVGANQASSDTLNKVQLFTAPWSVKACAITSGLDVAAVCIIKERRALSLERVEEGISKFIQDPTVEETLGMLEQSI